ncbi:hypothetical protein ACFOPN_16125 [Xanthomonas hyacinthi]|uniref:hypothetical protein n=1 Tax=Xanthomonas hyacinthi TaxID=56455 RepID=UPI000A4DE92F
MSSRATGADGLPAYRASAGSATRRAPARSRACYRDRARACHPFPPAAWPLRRLSACIADGARRRNRVKSAACPS